MRRSQIPNPKSQIKPEGGFTLVEVLVALVVMAAALAVLAQGFTVGGQASVGAQNQTQAVFLADTKIAELEAGILPLNIGQTGTFDDPAEWRWEVVSEATTAVGLYQVTVAIRWEERGQGRSYRLVRLMRERPTP